MKQQLSAPCSVHCEKDLLCSTVLISVIGFLCVGQVGSAWGFYKNASNQFGYCLANTKRQDMGLQRWKVSSHHFLDQGEKQ